MVATLGTLSEYDMILSVSQKAINDQFEVLFNTPNPTKLEDDPPNLIPKAMKLGYIAYSKKEKKWVTTDYGVTAEIDCPTVELTDIGDGGITYRSLRLIIHMTSGKLTYFDTSSGEKDDEDVSGWTVSWVAKIGSRNIQNIEEEAMHPKAKKKIADGLKEVPHDDYLVSSLFCLFESTQVANSFKLTDKNNKSIDDISEIGTFLSSLQKTYEKMDPKQYPYVLGYGISQKIPHPVTGTPMYLPSTYTFSTTPYDKDKEQASLNFCMINANDHSLDDPKIKDNPSAGVFTPPFVYQTRAVNLKSDGVFAVSNALYFRQWLQKAILTPFDSGKRLAADMNCKVTSGPTITGGVGAREASSKTSWSVIANLRVPPIHSTLTGNTSVTLDYKSVLQAQPTGDISVATKRDMIINAKGSTYVKMELTVPGIVGTDAGYVDVTADWDFQLKVASAEDGKWSVERKIWHIPETGKPQLHLTGSLLNIVQMIEQLFLQIIGVFLKTWLEGVAKTDFEEAGSKLRSISTALIMPAGDVYTFLGVDCDNNGNLFSHIKYKTIL